MTFWLGFKVRLIYLISARGIVACAVGPSDVGGGSTGRDAIIEKAYTVEWLQAVVAVTNNIISPVGVSDIYKNRWNKNPNY